MTDKARWSITERAKDLEKGKGFQKENAKLQDTRKQVSPKPCESEGNCK